MQNLSQKIFEFIKQHPDYKDHVLDKMVAAGIPKAIASRLDDRFFVSSASTKEQIEIVKILDSFYRTDFFRNYLQKENLYEQSTVFFSDVSKIKHFYYTVINSGTLTDLIIEQKIVTPFPFGRIKNIRSTKMTCYSLSNIVLEYEDDSDVIFSNQDLFIKNQIFMSYDSACTFATLLRTGVQIDIPTFISIKRPPYFEKDIVILEETRNIAIDDINHGVGFDVIQTFNIHPNEIIDTLKKSTYSYDKTIDNLTNNLKIMNNRYKVEHIRKIFERSKGGALCDVLNKNFERWNR